MVNWGLFEGRAALAGIGDLRTMGARRFCNVAHGVIAAGLDPAGLARLEEWLDPKPVLTPEQIQEQLRPTWGTTPDAIEGQNAMIAMLEGAR